jgi:hypothetical protein
MQGKCLDAESRRIGNRLILKNWIGASHSNEEQPPIPLVNKINDLAHHSTISMAYVLYVEYLYYTVPGLSACRALGPVVYGSKVLGSGRGLQAASIRGGVLYL